MTVSEMYGNEGETVSTAFKFWRNSIIFQLQTEQPIIKVTNYYTISSRNSSRQTVELMTAKTPFRLFAFIQDLDWIFLERAPKRLSPVAGTFPAYRGSLKCHI